MNDYGLRRMLEQMMVLIKSQCRDKQVHEWAKKLADPLPTVREKVQAIVDGFRANARLHTRVDPSFSEVIASAAQVLFEDRPFDSDDVTVALGAACMSLGMKIKVIGASYDHQLIQHVYFAVEDENGEWLKVDGTSKLPVGEVHPAKREIEFRTFDVDKVAKALGAVPRGTVSAGGGYFGALQMVADVQALKGRRPMSVLDDLVGFVLWLRKTRRDPAILTEAELKKLASDYWQMQHGEDG